MVANEPAQVLVEVQKDVNELRDQFHGYASPGIPQP
jgi:hypothetical protein